MAKTNQPKKTPGYTNMMGPPEEIALLFGLLDLGHRWLVLNNRRLSRIVSLLFAIEMISAFMITNTSNVVILPKAMNQVCYLYLSVYGIFYFFVIGRTW
jgi:hypothetical protein